MNDLPHVHCQPRDYLSGERISLFLNNIMVTKTDVSSWQEAKKKKKNPNNFETSCSRAFGTRLYRPGLSPTSRPVLRAACACNFSPALSGGEVASFGPKERLRRRLGVKRNNEVFIIPLFLL